VQVESFNEAEKGRGGHRSCAKSVGVQKWNKPPLVVVKLNWDAAVKMEEQKMGLGIIARDHTGQVLAVSVASRLYITDPTTAEALAAWKMAEVCVSMGFQ
jgi:hypothetical protein